MLLLSLALFASAGDARVGAVEAVAQEATRALGAGLGPSVVVTAPLESDQAAPRGDDLALRVAARVAERLGSRAHPRAASLPAARAIAGRSSALVYVTSAVVEGDLRITADVYAPTANAWDRVRNPAAAPIGHALSSAKVDAEVRAFLMPLSLEQAVVSRVRHDEGEVLAAACGDVNGADALVLVSRARVTLGHVSTGRFVVERTAAWSHLASPLPVPMREPLAGAAVSRGAIYLGSTDRGGVEVAPDLSVRGPLVGVPAAVDGEVVCLRPEPGAGAFDGAPVGCAPGRDVGPRMALPAPRFDAFASATVVDAAGAAHAVVAVREPSGRLKLKMGDSTRAPDGAFGAQLALVDLDQDGVPDIVTTADTPDDAIRVLGWASGTADPTLRLRLPAPAGVRALAVCPPGAHGQPALVAIVGDEIWMVRAGDTGPTASGGGKP